MQKKKIIGRILDEVVRNKEGKIIATREFINEVISRGRHSERVIREIIKLGNEKVILNQILYRSKIKQYKNYQSVDLLTGLTQGG